MTHVAKIEGNRPNVVILELRRPPYNYLSLEVLEELADALEQLDSDDNCRAIVLAGEGKAFSAGADFSSRGDDASKDTAAFYRQAMRLFRARKPVIAAVHGPAVGAGLGLAVAADFRVCCPEARFSANFNRLGFHPGFGLSLTLPRLIGQQHASLLFYTGRRIDGTEAHHMGLADVLVDGAKVRTAAEDLAAEIALSAPLAVESTRETLRLGLADQVQEVNQRELALQRLQYATEDFKEGVAAMAERRAPCFKRR